MDKIIIFSTLVACTLAHPAFFIEDPHTKSIHSNQIIDHGTLYTHAYAPIVPLYHELSSKKSTITKSSQVVNHGGSEVVHAPLYHSYHPITEVKPLKTTVTKSNQVVDHGSTAVVHAPLPVFHHVSLPVVHSAVSFKAGERIGDSAVSHHSSTVHQTEPVLNHLPLYALHH